MKSSNPALGRIPTGQGYATWNQAPVQNAPSSGQLQDMYAQPAYAPPGYEAPSRYMTIDDVVTKTAVTLFVTVLSAAATWYLLEPAQSMPLAIGALLVGFVLGLVISFKTITNPLAILAYAAIEGVFLGAISEVFETYFPGIVIQAVIGTMGVFFGMLFVYKTGAIRVTPRLQRWVIGAGIGVVVLMLVNLVASFITPGGLGLRDGGPIAIGFSLLCIGIAAFFLLLDFDMIDQAIRRGAPEKFAWYAAFGLLVTLIWLYLEILRLLSYFRE